MMYRKLRLLFAFCSLAFAAGLSGGGCFANEPQSQSPQLRKSSTLPARPLRDRMLPGTVSANDSNSSNVSKASHASDVDNSSKEEIDPEIRSTNKDFEIPAALQAMQSLATIPIDMASAFSLIGIQNPEFLAAQQRVLEAAAQRQLAAVQLLPTINLGTSMDSHSGPLQQPSGNILTVNRQSLFVGAGASAVGSGTVNVPGVVWSLNVSDSYYNYLIIRQVQTQKVANVSSVHNDVQLRVATAYLDLVRSASARSIFWQARQDFAEVARITTDFARSGEGRPADANRAAVELLRRDSDVIKAEGQMVSASARLASLVGLDTAVRLMPTDRWAVPHSIVPEPIPLPELLTIAALGRPELAEQRAEFTRTLLALDAAKMLPFSPTVFIGFSSGSFGGGSDLATAPVGSTPYGSGQQRFGNFQARTDLDAIVYWSLRNLGVGNQAQIAASGSRVRQSEWQQLIVLDRVRAEVAAAYVRVHARFQQLKSAEESIRQADLSWREDLKRIQGNEGLPIEVLNSQRLLVRSRLALLNTIIDYNIAQFQLYHSLGQPQSELLVRTAVDVEPNENVDSQHDSEEVEESRGDIIPAAASNLVIDLGTGLHLAESQNPRMALAREIVNEARAHHREARALVLPTLTAGTDYHLHSGVLQASDGQIRKVDLQSLYMGGGTQTVGSQTVGVPAVRIFAHAGDAYYLPLAARQIVTARSFDSCAVDNLTLLDVAESYLTLVAAEARREVLLVSLRELGAIEQAQKEFARAGQGRDADYHRARSDLLLMRLDEEKAQEDAAVAAAELSRLLHLDPSVRLITPAGPIEMLDLVDETADVETLVVQALQQRPESTSRSAEIGAAEYRLRDERMRPWLPLISIGFSGGAYGGGSNRQDLGVPSFYTTTQGRTDLDIWALWTIQNLGAGNHSLQGIRKAERDQAIFRRAMTLSQIRREVAERQVQARARRRTVDVTWNQLAAAERGAREDLLLTRSGEVLPLEALNSVTRLASARQQLLTAVIEYNRAEFRLFVALGTSLSILNGSVFDSSTPDQSPVL